jgi:hypothetical protein
MARRISIIAVKAEFTPGQEMIGKMFPDLEDILVASSGKVKLSAQLPFNPNVPETFAQQQQVAIDFSELLHDSGEVHKFDQAIVTVKALDRERRATAGDDDNGSD